MSEQEEQYLMVCDCEKRKSKLSDWEATFIANIKLQIRSGEQLTKSQTEKLDEIWERATA